MYDSDFFELFRSEKADIITAKNVLAEGRDINKSLVCLGNVVQKLAEKAQYIPYRDSALTWLLKDSLGGNASTHIIITASPASCCHAQTLSSLRFAQRARLVENQPKVNTSNPSTPDMLANIPSFDIRKDIARLSNIIRSAQANGGILRGLMPNKYGFNRLISAIESWNHYHSNGEQKRQWPTRAASVDTPTASTSTTKSSSSDAMVQADAERDECFMSAPGSAAQSPIKTPGTEVFIPYSNSIKCLTWRQQEVKIVPKSVESIDSDSDESPPATMKANYLKYLLPVKYPVSRTLEAESRIGERIRNFQFEQPEFEYVTVTPKDVISDINYSVIRERHPTLVDSQEVPDILQESTSESEICDVRTICDSKVPVGFKSYTRNIPKFGFEIPSASEFSKPALMVYASAFESTDEDESTFDCSKNENKCFQSRFRLRRKVESKPMSSEEVLFFASESSSSLSSTPATSCESLKIEKDKYFFGRSNENRSVKVIKNCHFDFAEIEDNIFGLEIDPRRVEHHTASTISCSSKLTAGEEAQGLKINEMHHPLICRPLDGASSSKFRNHFVKEFHQMENIGNKIKNLRSMTQRCQIVKPYLDKIAMLSHQDHSQSVTELDAEIDECSGWNLDVEFRKVQEEIVALNKLLRHGVPKPMEAATPMEIHCTVSAVGSVNTALDMNKDSCPNTKRVEYEPYRRISTASSSSQPTSNEYSSYNYPSNVRMKSEYMPQDHTPLSSSRFHPNSYTQTVEHPSCTTKLRSRPILPKTHHYLHHSKICHNVLSHPSNAGTGIPHENQSDKCSFSSHEIISKSNESRSFSPSSLSVEHDSLCGRDTCNHSKHGLSDKSTFQSPRRRAKETFGESSPSIEFSYLENNMGTNSSSALMKKLSSVRKQLSDI